MVRQWTEFKAGPKKPTRDRLHVTLNARGVILLNLKAFEALGEPEAAVLLYDERSSVIGLQRATARIENAFPLAQKGKNAHRLIYATAFCRHFGIKVGATVVFPTADIDHDGILQLDLQTTTEVR